jgi:hypothetical protein
VRDERAVYGWENNGEGEIEERRGEDEYKINSKRKKRSKKTGTIEADNRREGDDSRLWIG